MSAAADTVTVGKRRGLVRRLWGLVWRAALILVLVPIVLVPVYRFVPAVSTLMVYDALTGQPVERTWVPLSAIAPSLQAAVLMSEDGRFCSHNGIDWDELAVVLDRGDEPARGASTIPMQTVKNLFLWQGRSYLRKALEFPLALYADAVWGKRRTMEIYLNIAEWGPGIFGAEAAAQHYFGRSAANLTSRQAALLAVTLPNPEARDPANPSAALNTLARRAERRASQAGAYIGCLAPSGSV